jgi:hypothetical protein
VKRAQLFGSRSDSALLWSPCVVALCAGFYLAFGLLGAAIDNQHRLTGRLSAVMLADAEILATQPLLERETRAIEDRLSILALRADRPVAVARFIHAVTRIAAAQRVNLVQIDERPTTAAVSPPGSGSVAFEEIPLELTLSGTYPSLLATIRELARAPVTMQIEIAAIERNMSATGDSAPLTARLHVVLQRLADDTSPPTPRTPVPEESTNHARPL